MEPAGDVARVILDPSVLFTEEALTWLETPELRPFLVISQALWKSLGDPEAGAQFERFGVRPSPEDVLRVRRVLEEIEKFSGDRSDLPAGARVIRDRLLESDEPLADVLADEWVFVTSQSLGVIRAAAKRTLDAFGRAGAKVYKVSDSRMKDGLSKIEESLPPGFLANMKRVDRKITKISGSRRGKLVALGGTIIVLGGTIGVVAVPYVGLGVGAAKVIRQGVGVIAGDP